MEKLHKMVNGERVYLSDEEEAAIRTKWEMNRIKSEKKRQEISEKKNKKAEAIKKLAAIANLSEEEQALLF